MRRLPGERDRRAEAVLRCAALRALAAGLRANRPRDQLYREILDCAVRVVGAGRGVVLVAGPEGNVTAVTATPGVAPIPEPACGDRSGGGAGYAVASVLAGLAETPGWDGLLRAELRLPDGCSGVLALAQPAEGTFGHDAGEWLELVTALVSTALDNVALVEEFQRFEELLQGAVETSAALVEATEPAAVRQRLLDGLVGDMGLPGAGLWCSELAGDDRGPGSARERVRLVASAGLPPRVRDAVAELPSTSQVARMLRGELPARRTGLVTGVASQAWPGHRLRLVAVPEPARGALGVYVDGAVPELVDQVLASLAHALAAAVHQATLHKRARTVVDSLQRQLRPREVVLPPAVEVGHVYRSATTGVDVGGDFFDLFTTRSEHVGLACGDVSGKGVEAASLTAMAVYSLRAYALRGASPQIVMTMLNGAVCEQTSVERFMTLAYARVDPRDWTVQLAVAGHPPPLLVGHEGVRVLELAPDVPVGLLPEADYHQVEFALEPGQSLLLYTDGVTDVRRDGPDGDELLGIDGLVSLLGETVTAGAQELADAVWDAVQSWSSRGTADDCAVVVLRRRAEPA